MQKLTMAQKNKGGRGERGSVLVTVVVFSVLMGISGATYLTLTTNSVNREVQGLNDAKAFAAAESGLLMGTQWLGKQTTWPTTDRAGIIKTTIDGISVSVDIDENAGEIRVVSTTPVSGASYDKALSWIVVQGKQSSGSLGTFFDDVMTFPGGNTHGIRKLDFDGPVHANSPIKIANGGGGNIPTFNSPVTVYNPSNRGDPSYNMPGHFGNDYTKGVLVEDGNAPNFNSVFLSTYDGSSRMRVVTFDEDGKSSLVLSAANKLVEFDVNSGTPTYTYTDADNIVRTVQYSPNDETKIWINGGNVQVKGTVKGKVTLYTDAPTADHPNTDISIIDNLVYDGFNTANFAPKNTGNNFGMGNTNPNVLALHSGGSVIVNVTKNTQRFITAQLFAVSNGNTIVFAGDGNKQTLVNLIGTRAVDYYWDEKQGNDQITFNHYYDRRKLQAPGLQYSIIDNAGNQIKQISVTNWAEANIPKI